MNRSKKWKKDGWHFTFSNGKTASVIPEYNIHEISSTGRMPKLPGEWEVMELASEYDTEPKRHLSDVELLDELMRIALL